LTLIVTPVEDRRALRRFIDLPAVLYRGLPFSEPPLRLERAKLLDPRKGAFFKHGSVRYWMALRDGVPVGRISAQIGQDQPVGVPPHTGMFGCLDAIDDRTVIAALLDRAESWLMEQGCEHAFGPFVLNMNGEPGLLIDGFEEPPMTMTPWHPPYMKAHLEGLGFEKWKDLNSWKREVQGFDGDAFRQEMRLDLRRKDITARPISGRTLRADLPILRDLYNDGWGDNWGHVPLTLDDLHGLLTLAPLMPPETGRVFEMDGEPVAVLFGIPNIFELTAGLGPTPSLLGWLRLGWRVLRYRPRTGRILLLGISSRMRFSAAGAAIMLTMMDEMLKQQQGIEHRGFDLEAIEGGWVLEDNAALTRFLVRYNFTVTRTFRIFGKTLADGATQGLRKND
jgi:hypothetical protein